jgi:ketosteroid isomerase-like protein
MESSALARDTQRAMSKENVETVERMWETLMSGDPFTLPRSFIDPEVIYEDEILPDHVGETYHGHEGIQRAWTQALEPVRGGVFENDLVWARDAGDAVVSCHHVQSQGASGVELEFDYAYVWKLREGKVFYCKAFRDPSDALQAAGLSE